VIDWLRLQYRQELHDKLYHQDIYVLSKKERLAHLVLHHTKYVSKLFGGGGRNDAKLLIDGVIVSLSILNVCNHRAAWSTSERSVSYDETVAFMIQAMGRLAKYVEDMDHLAFNEGIRELGSITNQLMGAYIDLMKDHSLLINNYNTRMEEIEEKSIFHRQHRDVIGQEMQLYDEKLDFYIKSQSV